MFLYALSGRSFALPDYTRIDIHTPRQLRICKKAAVDPPSLPMLVFPGAQHSEVHGSRRGRLEGS
jgi:hypothetical protein